MKTNLISRGFSVLVIMLVAAFSLLPARATELIVNGGFESGSGTSVPNWTLAGGAALNGAAGSSAYAHGGSQYLILGGAVGEHDSTYQTGIAVPSGATTVTLSFWYSITSQETAVNTAYDTMTIAVRNSSGSVLQTIATYSNLNKDSAPGTWHQVTANLAAYAGQTIQIYFSSSNDSTLYTTFRVDDVSVQVTMPSAPTMTLNSPNAGATWQVGTSQTVGWSVSGDTSQISYFVVRLSLNNGSSYTDISANLSASTQSFNYTPTSGQATTTAVVWVRAFNSSGTVLAGAISSGTFTIIAVSTPAVSVTAPNGGETWGLGVAHTINWSVTGDTSQINNFLVSYSLDGGTTYQNDVGTATSASRSISWTPPLVISPTAMGRIRVQARNASNSVLSQDVSDGTFTFGSSTILAGFDTHTYPGDSVMAWLRQNSNLSWVGYYLYPAPSRNVASNGGNSWMGHLSTLSAQWTVAPIYIGEQDPAHASQDPGNSSNPSTAKGTQDGNSSEVNSIGLANSAVPLLIQEGFPIGTTIYLDIETSGAQSQPELDYISAWCLAVSNAGYVPGIYCLESAYSSVATVEPSVPFWIANPTNPSPGGTPYPTMDPSGSGVANAIVWQYESASSYTIAIQSGTLQVDLDVVKSSTSQPTTVAIAFATSPAGLQVTVDGTTYTTPTTFNWTPSSQHTLSVPTPQYSGLYSRYQFSGTQNQTITTPSASETITATLTTQYDLTESAGTGGSVNSSGGWYDSGSVVSISATANSGYSFSSWTGSGTGSYYSGNSSSTSITMNGPIFETANFTANPTTYTITASAGSGGSISPNGSFSRNAGDSQAFTATPNVSYMVNQWLVDSGVAQTGGTSYSLNNIQSGHSVQVTFIQASSPKISNPHRTGTTFMLSVPTTQVGFNYTLEYKNSFSDANWTTGQTISGTGGTITLTDPTATGSSRLYHVRVQ